MKPKTRKYLNYFIDIFIGIAFILVCVTGVIKYPPFQALFGINVANIRYGAITLIHDLSGIVVTVLALLHILLHLKWLKSVTLQLLTSKRPATRITLILVLCSLAFILLLSFIIMLMPVKSAPNNEYTNIKTPTPTIPSQTMSATPESTPMSTPASTPKPSPTTTTYRPPRGNHGGQLNIPDGLDLSQYTLKDGVYLGEATAYRPGMQVEVTIEGGKITDIQVKAHNESPGFYERPFEMLPPEIIDHQSTDVDTISGATMTSYGYLSAVEDAISKAIK